MNRFPSALQWSRKSVLASAAVLMLTALAFTVPGTLLADNGHGDDGHGDDGNGKNKNYPYGVNQQSRRPYSIGLWGDLPYSAEQAAVIPKLLADMNSQDLVFTAHDGDLRQGSGSPNCADGSIYTRAAGYFSSLHAPAIFTPGDNDWTDCDRKSLGADGRNSLQILDNERALFFSTHHTLGQTQFLPAHYVNYAVDYDGDGRRNLLRSAPDVIGSTANYIATGLKWRRGEPWLEEVRAPASASFSWEQADLTTQLPRAKWAQLGVTYADGRALPNDNLPASLLLPMGRTGPAFLAYANFAAYTEWNNSLIYSTTAGYLASRIAGAAPMRRPAAAVAQLPFNEIKELQQLLVRAGFNVGKVDGVLGQQSRSAVKAMQIKYGLPADSWPTAELLARMRGTPRAANL